MSDFKAGDRVLINDNCPALAGRVGTVGTVKVGTSNLGYVDVILDGEDFRRGFLVESLDLLAVKANNLTDKQVHVYNAMMALNEAKNELRLAIEDMDD